MKLTIASKDGFLSTFDKNEEGTNDIHINIDVYSADENGVNIGLEIQDYQNNLKKIDLSRHNTQSMSINITKEEAGVLGKYLIGISKME